MVTELEHKYSNYTYPGGAGNLEDRYSEKIKKLKSQGYDIIFRKNQFGWHPNGFDTVYIGATDPGMMMDKKLKAHLTVVCYAIKEVGGQIPGTIYGRNVNN